MCVSLTITIIWCIPRCVSYGNRWLGKLSGGETAERKWGVLPYKVRKKRIYDLDSTCFIPSCVLPAHAFHKRCFRSLEQMDSEVRRDGRLMDLVDQAWKEDVLPKVCEVANSEKHSGQTSGHQIAAATESKVVKAEVNLRDECADCTLLRFVVVCQKPYVCFLCGRRTWPSRTWSSRSSSQITGTTTRLRENRSRSGPTSR